jgi:sulfur carrier protein ThiS adenylyltransferase
MNPLETALAGQLGEARLSRLQKVRVGLAGAGGLGSNCAANLVRSGFKQLVLVDFDAVEASNLNRQFFFADQVGMVKVVALRSNLLRINPDLELTLAPEKVTRENLDRFFGACQVVVEALDRPESKRMLVEHFWNSSKLLVSASGLAGWGRSDAMVTRKYGKNLYVVGDQDTGVTPGRPPVAPRVNLAAAKQADIILNWVLGECDFE